MKSPALFDQLGPQKWQEGLCHVYAQALRSFLGSGVFICLYRNMRFAHIYLKLDGLAYDSESHGVPDAEFKETYARKKQSDWPLEWRSAHEIRDFGDERLGESRITFGTDIDSCDAYEGPHTPRFLAEARATIEQNQYYQELKSRIAASPLDRP